MLQLDVRELGPLGGLGSWSLGAGELGELGELVPAAPFELGENEPLAVCRAQRAHSPELGRKPAQLGQVGWDVLRRAMLESGRAEGLTVCANQPCSSAIWSIAAFWRANNDASGVPNASHGQVTTACNFDCKL